MKQKQRVYWAVVWNAPGIPTDPLEHVYEANYQALAIFQKESAAVKFMKQVAGEGHSTILPVHITPLKRTPNRKSV